MLILDTYNLLHAASARHGAVTGLSVRQLCHVCRDLKLTMVMDRDRKPDEPGSDEFDMLTLVWSGPSMSADDKIVRICEASSGRRDICVVTDDRRLSARVHHVGGKSMPCAAFLSQLYTRRRQSREASEPLIKTGEGAAPGETDRWLEIFGFTPNAPRPSAADAATQQRPADSHELTDAEIAAIDMSAFLE